MAEKIYFQWQKEYLDEQGKILLKLEPLRKRIESLEIDRKKIENNIARLSNSRRMEDILSYFSKTNIHGEIRRRFAQADEAVLNVVIDRIGSMIGNAITDFYKEIPQRIKLWNDQGRKKKDPTLAWVRDQSAKLQDAPKKLDNMMDALEEGNKSLQIGSPRLANRLSVLNILSDPEMRAIIAKELDKLEELQAAIDYSQLTQEELNQMIQGQMQKLEVLQNKISQEKKKADVLQKKLEPVESALYITEEKFLAGSSAGANLGIRTKKWCFVATDVYDAPNGKKLDKIPNRVPIPQRAVVELTGNQKNLDDILWLEITYNYKEYSKDEKKWKDFTVTGWVNAVYLDDYIEINSPEEVKFNHATEDPYDAKQYMFVDADFDGNLDPDVKYNMCGEICVAYIVEYEIDPESSIESVLKKWKNDGKGYRAKTIKEGTNASDLKNILQAYDKYRNDQDPELIVDFRTGLKDGSLTYEGMKEKLKTHYLIALITIDPSGALIPKSHPKTLHWVVLEKFTKSGSRVELYNPFPNKREEYSFSEFVSSCRPSLSGLWVKRKKAIKVDFDMPPSKRSGEVELDVPKPVDYKAEQYIIREGEKKTNLCGEFCVGYIVGKSINGVMEHWRVPPSGLWNIVTILKAYGYYRKDKKDKPAPHTFSIGTVLDHWRDTQPSLYEYHVGKNKPTGTRELRTILKAYGYSDDDFEEFNKGLTDKSATYLPSPGRMKKKLETHFLIAGVGIDGSSGKLITGPKGVRHWEVLEKLEPIGKHYLDKHFGGNGGWVELYNPFTNILEEYSYREFVDSMSETGNWAGLWVKREIIPTFEPQEVLPAYIEGKKGEGRSKGGNPAKWWPEQKLLAEISKKVKHGTPPEKIPALLMKEGSGWSAGEIAKRLPASKNNRSKLRDGLEALVRERLEVDSIPPEISEWIGEKSDGDPLLAVDLAYALRESGILADEDGKGIIPINLDSPALHKTLKSAVTSHIVDAPKPAAQTTLNIARTIGLAFSLKAIEEIKDIQAKQYIENKRVTFLKYRPKPEKALLPICDFVQWTDSLAAANENLWKVRIWGDPKLPGLNVTDADTTNFQAVGLYNKITGRGAVTNFITIEREDIDMLMALQVEDEFENKHKDKEKDWLKQKMNWLCKEKGTIYFTKDSGNEWETGPYIFWGTLALGGNLVQVEGKPIKMEFPGGESEIEVRKLVGFKKSDWYTPLDELLAKGLVHRCFCAYKGDKPGDSPNGIIYSPFFSLEDWRFGEGGHKTPEALYIPVDQLVKPRSKDEDGKEYEGIFQKFNCDEKE